MADSATSILRLRDQESGGNDSLWGTYTDINLTLVEDAVAGVLSKDIGGAGDITLTSTNFVADEARHAVLELTGTLTGIRNVVIPNAQKTYFINNKTGNEFAVFIKTSSGSAVEIAFGKDIVYCDGNNVITTLLGSSLADTVTQVNNGTLSSIAANIAAIKGVNTNEANITQVSAINAAVSSVAANASNINAAANAATNIATVVAEPLATNIGTVAGLSSEISTLNGINSAISTVSGISSNVSTVAGIASAVSTTATNSSAVTAFSLVYHGAASSDPSARSDSSSLQAGDLYFNTSDNVLEVYTGSAWQAAALDSSAFASSDLQLSNSTQHNILVADGTNFESVSVGSLSEISTVANDDLFLAIDTSGGGLKKITRSAVVAGLATSGAISNVVEDSTPQLGGNLDINGNDIVTTSNADIDLAPNGTGKVVVKGNDNQGAIVLNCENNSHGQTITAQAHSAGVTNVLTLPAGSNQELVGTSATQTLSAKTLTEPKFADAGFIADANGNEMVVFQTTSSAVNALEVTNSATGNAIVLGAFGSDSNVDIDLTPKGTGEVNIGASNLNYGGTAVTSTGAELNLVDGSSAATIVNSKAVIYGSSGEVNATTLQIAGTSITASAAEINKLASLSTTAAELGHVNGVTSAIQTQLNTKASTGKAIAMAMVFG